MNSQNQIRNKQEGKRGRNMENGLQNLMTMESVAVHNETNVKERRRILTRRNN